MRKDGADPSVSVTVAGRTKDRFRFVTPEEVNDIGPDNLAYLYSSMEEHVFQVDGNVIGLQITSLVKRLQIEFCFYNDVQICHNFIVVPERVTCSLQQVITSPSSLPTPSSFSRFTTLPRGATFYSFSINLLETSRNQT